MKSMRCRSWGCFCDMWDKMRAPVELPIAFHGLPPESADVCHVMSARACQPGFSRRRALASFDIVSIPKCGSIPKNAARTQECAGNHLNHILLHLQNAARQQRLCKCRYMPRRRVQFKRLQILLRKFEFRSGRPDPEPVSGSAREKFYDCLICGTVKLP
jgi:hypothetical protein